MNYIVDVFNEDKKIVVSLLVKGCDSNNKEYLGLLIKEAIEAIDFKYYELRKSKI